MLTACFFVPNGCVVSHQPGEGWRYPLAEDEAGWAVTAPVS